MSLRSISSGGQAEAISMVKAAFSRVSGGIARWSSPDTVHTVMPAAPPSMASSARMRACSVSRDTLAAE